MSDVFESIGELFGMNNDAAENNAASTTDAESTVTTDQTKAKAIRSALYATAGGAAGQELSLGQVSRRGTLYGN